MVCLRAEAHGHYGHGYVTPEALSDNFAGPSILEHVAGNAHMYLCKSLGRMLSPTDHAITWTAIGHERIDWPYGP